MSAVHHQGKWDVRFDWGPAGATALAEEGVCLVVVDVLSFTTAVSVAVSRGTAVYPYRWRDESARRFAEFHDAKLAVNRSEVTEECPWSLSPWALTHAPSVGRLVLPSPNGAAIAAAAAAGTVVASCLRNGKAVTRKLIGNGWGRPNRPIVVIAAGERWPDGSIRPALEDMIGAGQVVAELVRSGCDASPEAMSAAAAFASVTDLERTLDDCASGRELNASGFANDVKTAAALNVDACVPLLQDQAFTNCA